MIFALFVLLYWFALVAQTTNTMVTTYTELVAGLANHGSSNARVKQTIAVDPSSDGFGTNGAKLYCIVSPCLTIDQQRTKPLTITGIHFNVSKQPTSLIVAID